MPSEMLDLAAVIGRLENLEHQNRPLKLTGAIVLALTCAVLLMGQAPE